MTMQGEILLHMCCAPCSIFIAEDLLNQDIAFTGIYYNPNIHPEKEFHERKRSTQELAANKGFNLVLSDEYHYARWKGYTGNKADRCMMCYEERIEEIAKYASKNGFSAFTTSLLISPYQNHDLVVELSHKYAKRYHVSFYYKDYRPFFREGQRLSKEVGLYMQKYCGCVNSYHESDYSKKPIYQFK